MRDQPGLPFNLAEGQRRKEAGIEQVLSNGAAFKDQVRILIRIVARRGLEFTNDDVRALASELGVEEPHHPNAWGAAVSSAAKAGEIERVGYRKSAAISRHAGLVAVWRRVH